MRKALIVVYGTVFLDLLGFGIILPLLPFYAERYGATGAGVGALLTAYSAAQLVGAPILGRASDRFGRRPILLLSLLGSTVSLALTGVADSLALLLVGRTLAGLFGGSVATAQAYVADVTEPAGRTRAMGLLGACVGMGFVFGPAIGAGLSSFGFSAAAFAAAGLAAGNLVLACLFVREPDTRSQAGSAHRRFTLLDVQDALRQPNTGRLLTATFLATGAFVSMEATFALLGEQRFGLNQASLGVAFTFAGVVLAAVQGGLIGRLSARYGERKVGPAGAGLMGFALLTLPWAPTLPLAVVVLAALAAGQGLVVPTLSSLLSQESHPGGQGATLGMGQSFSAGARAVGPLAAGWLFDRGEALPYLAGAMLVLLAASLLLGMGQAAPAASQHQRAVQRAACVTEP